MRALVSSVRAANATLAAQAIASGSQLPARDVRYSLDDAVRRGWSEHTRRVARIATLLTADTLAGLAGVAFVLNTWWLVSNGGLRPVPNAIPLIAMVFCIQPLALRVTGAYGGSRSRVSILRICAGVVIAALIGWLQARLFGQLSPDLPNKAAYLYSAAVIALHISAERVALDRAIKLCFRAGFLQRRVLLVAHRDELEQVQRRIDHSVASDVKIVAALSPQHLLDDVKALDEAITSSHAHAVVVAASLPNELLEGLIARCFSNGIGISLLPGGIQDFGSAYFELRPSNVGLLLQVFPIRFGLPQLAIKRTMDVLLTLAGLLVIWPLLLAVAVLVKLDSTGPVFFRQWRLGVGGKQFQILKFRTMCVDAEARKAELQHLNAYGDGKLFKIKEDPRVTRVGRILRKTSIDELPQLLNVLKGEMSLVGPRPCVPAEFAHYEPHHFVRLVVTPGVTGPWQVNGRNDVLDFDAVVHLEQQYIRSWSLLQDIVILVRTVPALMGRGAY